MQNPWQAKAAEFRIRAADAEDPYLRDEFEGIAAAYEKLGAQCDADLPDGDDPSPRYAKDC
jgi:hypothetical protein